MVGGLLGVLMMIPLRRSLIVKEHARLPYPEGTACASVLIAGEKGGDLARTAYQGLGVAFLYAMLQKVIRLVAETPSARHPRHQPLSAGGRLQRRHHPRVPGRRLHHRPADRRRAGGRRRAGLAGADPASDRGGAARRHRGAAGQARLPAEPGHGRRTGRMEPGHACLRRQRGRRVPRLRPANRRRRRGRGRVHHALADAAHHRVVVPREPGRPAQPRSRAGPPAPSATCRSPSCWSARRC